MRVPSGTFDFLIILRRVPGLALQVPVGVGGCHPVERHPGRRHGNAFPVPVDISPLSRHFCGAAALPQPPTAEPPARMLPHSSHPCLPHCSSAPWGRCMEALERTLQESSRICHLLQQKIISRLGEGTSRCSPVHCSVIEG